MRKDETMLKVGDKVMVVLPPSEATVRGEVRTTDRVISTIAEVHQTPKGQNQYRLNGVESKRGKPFWYLSSSLTKVFESEVTE